MKVKKIAETLDGIWELLRYEKISEELKNDLVKFLKENDKKILKIRKKYLLENEFKEIDKQMIELIEKNGAKTSFGNYKIFNNDILIPIEKIRKYTKKIEELENKFNELNEKLKNNLDRDIDFEFIIKINPEYLPPEISLSVYNKIRWLVNDN